MLPAEKKWEKMRVCNSDDLKVSEDQRQCLTTALSSYYEEVRISIQYWDTPTYEAWVAQILLSELLGVPTTIEANKPDVNMNFYNSENNFAIGSIFGEGEGDYGQWQHLARGGEIGDCTKANRDYENYEPCSNFVPEFWNYDDILKKMNAEELIEPYQFLGAEGLEGWFIPKFTALQDPALLSYLGLQNKNRKLAGTCMFIKETFRLEPSYKLFTLTKFIPLIFLFVLLQRLFCNQLLGKNTATFIRTVIAGQKTVRLSVSRRTTLKTIVFLSRACIKDFSARLMITTASTRTAQDTLSTIPVVGAVLLRHRHITSILLSRVKAARFLTATKRVK